MRSEIEQRIVQMRFDNGQFERGAKQSLSTLEKLDGVLDTLGNAGGISKISGVLDELQYRFSSFGIAGAAAIERITNKVIDLTKNLVSAPFQQILNGGANRALNIAQAQFMINGLNPDWWEKLSQEGRYIDRAVKGTAYGFDEAASAAAQFAASNVDLDHTFEFKHMNGAVEQVTDMELALRGVSGVAAMTNSAYSDIANIFIDAAAQGRLTGDTLMRLSYRGINVAATLAKYLEEDGTNAQYTEEQIKDMVSKGEISFKDFAKVMDYAFGDHATAANETYTGSLMNMQAALSRIGADYMGPWFQGMTKVQNGLREMFDRLRKVTRPFADSERGSGRWAEWVTHFSDLFYDMVSKVDFSGLSAFFEILEGIDYTKLDGLFIRAGKFFESLGTKGTRIKTVIEAYKSLMNGKSKEELFGVGKNTLDRLSKVVTIVQALKRVGEVAAKVIKDLWINLRSFGRGAIGLAIDKVLDFGTAIASLTESEHWVGRTVNAFSTAFAKFGKIGGSLFKTLVTAGETAGVIFKSLFETLKNHGIIKTTGTVFEWLGDVIFKASETLRGWLERLKELIEENGLLPGLFKSVGQAFGDLGKFLSDAAHGIGDFLRTLLGLGEGESVWTKLGEVVGKVGEQIGDALDFVKQGISDLQTGKTNPIKFAVGLIGALMGFRKLRALKWAIGRNKRGLEFLTKPFETLSEAKETIWGWIKGANPLEWADKIETFLGRVSAALRAFAENQNAKSLFYIGAAVTALAFGLSVLAAIAEDPKALGNGIFALTAIMAVLIGALWAIKAVTSRGLLTDITKGWKGLFDVLKNGIAKYFDALAFKETAKALMFFAAAVGILALAVGLLAYVASKQTDKHELWQAAGAIAGLVVVLAGVMWAMQAISKDVGMIDSTKFLALGASMIFVSLAILLMAAALGAIYKMGMNDPGALMASIVVLGALAAVLVGVMAGLNKWAKNPRIALVATSMLAVAASILIMVAALWALSWVLPELANININAIAAGLAALMMVVIPLGLLGKYLKPTELFSAAGAILVVSLALLLVTGSLYALSKFASDDTLMTFVVILGGITAALLLLGQNAPAVNKASGAIIKVSAALIIAAIAMAILGGALHIFKGVDENEFMNMAITLAAVAIGFKLISDMLDPVKVMLAAESLIVAGIALGVIGIALNMFDLGSFDNVFNIFMALLGIVAVLAVLGALGAEGLLGAVVLAAAGAALLVAAPGLRALAEALPHLATGIAAFSGVDWGAIGKTLAGLIALLPALMVLPFVAFSGASGPAVLVALGDALPSLANGIKAFSGVDWGDIGKTFIGLTGALPALFLLDFASFLGSGGPTVLGALGDSLPKLAAGIRAFADVGGWDIVKTFASVATGIGSLLLLDMSKAGSFVTFAGAVEQLKNAVIGIPANAGEILKALAEGIAANANIPVDAIVSVANSMSAVFSSGYISNWVTIGGNLPRGISQGIARDAYIAQQTMNELAASLTRSFTVELGIKSPSRVFMNLASYIPAGVAKGIESGESQVTDAMATSLSGALGLIEQYMDNAGTYSPVITPIVDLSNITDSASYMQGMFDKDYGVYAGVSSDISNRAAASMEAMRSSMTNNNFAPVINVYGSEGQDVNELANAVMDRMQFEFGRRTAAFG